MRWPGASPDAAAMASGSSVLGWNSTVRPARPGPGIGVGAAGNACLGRLPSCRWWARRTIRSLAPAWPWRRRTRCSWPPESLLTLRSEISGDPGASAPGPRGHAAGACLRQATISRTVTSSIRPPLCSIAPTGRRRSLRRVVVPTSRNGALSAFRRPSSSRARWYFPGGRRAEQATVLARVQFQAQAGDGVHGAYSCHVVEADGRVLPLSRSPALLLLTAAAVAAWKLARSGGVLQCQIIVSFA